MDGVIETMMRELKLSGLALHWREVPYENTEQYVHALMQLELTEKKAARTNRLISAAGFNVLKTLDDFTWHSGIQLPAGLSRTDIEELSFLTTHDNLILLGSVGTGKTHLATAVGVEACRQGKRVRFFTVAGLGNQLLEKNEKGCLSRFVRSLERTDLIILDEMGFVPLHKDAAELLFQVISACYERKSLVITSNLEFSRWNTVLGDTHLTVALIDRIVHHSHIVVFNGESFRLAQSAARLQHASNAV